MMKQLMEFLKTTAMGGLFVLLPILLLYLLLAEALGMIVALATPIADLVGFCLCLYYVIGEFKYLDTPGSDEGESYSEVRI